jgi:hypothetical protein
MEYSYVMCVFRKLCCSCAEKKIRQNMKFPYLGEIDLLRSFLPQARA